jgi:tetratricopeptide (TPR) repeat protein
VIIAQDERSVDALLERLSGLPLALTQAAAYINQTAVSVAQYLEYYDRMGKDLMEQQQEYSLQEHAQRNLLTTCKISYEQVKRQSEEASSLLRLWSFLYAGDLWYELVACTKELGAETVVPEWLTVLARDRLSFARALALLIKYSLVAAKTETASYAMHPLLHSWCRNLVKSEAERDLYRNLATEIVGRMAPSDSTKEYWVLQRRLLPHGQAILAGMRSEKRLETNLHVILAYQQLARMFGAHDRYMEAEEMYERALAGYMTALGPEHTSILITVNSLGILYAGQGRLAEAEEMHARALAGYEKALGPEHTSTLSTVNNLGLLYADQGRLAEAEAMYKRALAGYEKALGPDHTSTFSTVNNLGGLYRRQGRLAEAEAMYKRALAGNEKALGPEHTSTLNTVNNLGNLYRDQGKFAEAEAMYKRALAGYEKALGSEHTSTLDTVNNLGLLYADQGRLAEAQAMYERALAGYEKALGPEHTSTLDTVNKLGLLYRKRHYLHVSSINKLRAQYSTFALKVDRSSRFIVPVSRVWTKWGLARTELMEHLGHMLLLVGRLQDAVVAFEQQIISRGFLHSNVVCDGCENPIRLPDIRFVCASCNDVDLCPTCYQSYELEGQLDMKLPTCQDHAFLAVPREEWSTLPPGVVSTDGTTAKEWMNNLLVSLTESNLDT